MLEDDTPDAVEVIFQAIVGAVCCVGTMGLIATPVFKALSSGDYTIVGPAGYLNGLPIFTFLGALYYLRDKYRGRKVSIPALAMLSSIVGAALAVTFALSSLLEFANGRYDNTAQVVAAKPLELHIFDGQHPYVNIDVEDPAAIDGITTLGWGKTVPDGLDRPNTCIIARAGRGTLGMPWIGSERVGPCQPAPTPNAVWHRHSTLATMKARR